MGKLIAGDLSIGIKFEGYIVDGNIYLVSYASGYKKTVEIKGRISDLGNIRKVHYKVELLKTIDWIFFWSIMLFVICFIISIINNIPGFISFFIYLFTIIIIIKIFISFDKKTTFRLGQRLFKVMITGNIE